ncbi:MAG: diaminopimelate decarboxylase [Patescibacteria group bacterium]|jgi:diaminopimelate decarboxylase
MKFLTDEQARQIGHQFGTPVYVYSEAELVNSAKALLAFPHAFGLTVRYAMKACPNRAILQILTQQGLHIDASSGYEVHRAIAAGISADKIQLTSQQLPDDILELATLGVRFNACSLHQLETFGRLCNSERIEPTADCRNISIRVNPGLGSGHCGRCNTGGSGSSFGIWHQQLASAKALAEKYGLKITRLHTHIGSGSDPAVWVRVADMSLLIAERLPDVEMVNLGGGFKIGRVETEITTDLQVCGEAVKKAFERFAQRTGRELKLEIEPGTYVVAGAGSIVASVIDVVSTKPGDGGQTFIKVDTGMTENLRSSLYGAQHPITVVPMSAGQNRGMHLYVVVGHCCESGDLLTPAPGEPETIATRRLTEARIGDYVVIDFTGAYCAGMSGAGYNSFPAAPEVLARLDGTFQLIRHRQTLSQLIQNEIGLD